jgi:energy-coupling factor transporter ATP-binding protein EcfA2
MSEHKQAFIPKALIADEIRRRVWEELGLEIAKDDPIIAAQIMVLAGCEDMNELLVQHDQTLAQNFDHALQNWKQQSEDLLQSIAGKLSEQSIKDRISLMAEQVNRSDALAHTLTDLSKGMKRNVRLFKIFTFINVLSLSVAVLIMFLITG